MHLYMNHSLESSGCQKAFLEIPKGSSGPNEDPLIAGVFSVGMVEMLSLHKR